MRYNFFIYKNYQRYLIGFVLLLQFLLVPLISISQTDSTKKSMSFDFGITRDRNINLWPIYKRTISKFEIDKQLLFPIYRNYHNLREGEKRSHLIPFFWKDSSQNGENLRLFSTYYPSLVHISKNKNVDTKTFTFMEFAPRINLLEFKRSPDGLVMQNNLLFFLWYQNNQITNRSHLIVFPAYWHFKNKVRETSTLFPLYSYGSYKYGQTNYCAITPLFWHFQSAKRSSTLFIPLWWNRKTGVGDKFTSNKLLFPVYWGYKDQNTNNNVVFPLAWSFENQRYKSFTFIPVFSTGHSIDLERHHLVITPLFWHFKNREGESTAFFPLVWSSSWKTKYEKYSTFLVLPVYLSQWNNDERTQIILPFVWIKNTTYYKTFSFLPLLSVGHSPDKTSGHIAVTPLFWHYKSPDINSNTLFPLWWYRKRGIGDEAQTTNVIFPLYWEKKDTSSHRNIFFPLVWNFNNTEYHTFTFAPLFSTGKSKDGKSSYTAISPLYWRFRTEQGKGQLLFPLWWHKDKTTQGELKSSSLVVLLYWKYKDTERKHQGVFPLAWKLQNKSSKSFTLFPVFSYGQSIDRTKKYLAATPLFWHFKNHQRTINTLFPIWWNKNVNDSLNPRRFNLLIPIYYSKWDSIKSTKVLFPIIWSLKNTNYQSFTFVPLLSYGHSSDESRKHLMLTPLFWHFHNMDGYTSSLIPFFWSSKYGEGESAVKWSVIFPIYWSNKDSQKNNHVLAPIIWSFNNTNYRSLTIAPLFSFGKSTDSLKHHIVLTPLFWHIKTPKGYSNILFPIWWSSKKEIKKTVVKTDILFPIYWSFSNQRRSTKVVFPLVWSFRSSKTHSFTFAPLFSYGQNKNGIKHVMITPLFWKFDSNAAHRRVFFPLFNSYRDTSNHKRFDLLFFLFRRESTTDSTNLSILWPIIERSKSTNYRYFRFAPFVWSKKSPSFSYFTIQPFFYRSYSTDHKTFRVLWELYTYRNQIGEKRSNGILWKVVTWERYTNGDSSFRLLHLLYSNSNVKGNIEKSLFPFYYLTKESNGNRSLSVFLYFYNSLKRQIPNTKEFYQEERIFWLIRIRSNYRTLKQKGIDVD